MLITEEVVVFIPLICNQCGGELVVKDTQVAVSGDTVTVLPNQEFECAHCRTKYVEGMKSKHTLNTDNNVNINGDFSGDIIIGIGNTIINSPTEPNKR
jgi:hypothetical protein